MTDFLARHGITACFPHGHGLGLELRDYPIIVPDTGLRISDDCVDLPADLPLEPGMVINLEVLICSHLSDSFVLRHSRTVFRLIAF